MGNTTHRWAEELSSAATTLGTIKDEVQVQLHLGSMEAKQRFEALETRLENEQLAMHKSFKELVAGFREVKDGLPKAPVTPRSR